MKDPFQNLLKATLVASASAGVVTFIGSGVWGITGVIFVTFIGVLISLNFY